MQAFAVVDEFERRIAEFAGSPYAVAVNSGTSALFLSLHYHRIDKMQIRLPAHTFISVPMAVVQCGMVPTFHDLVWQGVYSLNPLPVVDGALRFRRGMYEGGLHCLSFQARKLLNIGEGGAILTDSIDARDWLRRARYCGRSGPDYHVEDIESMGWQMYMTPEKAARGLHLMEYIGDNLPDQQMTYPDLRKVKYFHEQKRLPVGRELRVA